MAFDNFFQTLSQTASDSDYTGIFGTTASTLSLSADLSSLSAEAAEIVTWIRYRLGEPKISVEIDNLQIFASFEEANIEYSSTINRFQAKNWLSNYLGLSRDFNTQDFSNKLPHQTLDYLRRLANPYASEAGVGGVQETRKAYVNHLPGTTDYDLLTDFIDNTTGSGIDDYISSISSARIEVRRVWYSDAATINRFYDPYSSTNILNQEFQYESIPKETFFEIYPIWTDILRAGMLETSDRVRRSNVTYHIAGSRIRLLPSPVAPMRVWIEYTTEMDPFNPPFAGPDGDPSVDGITSLSNVPFRDLKYEDVNASGKRWIRQMTLAISMEILGRIRRKYSSIPIPNNEVTLDGDALVAEAMDKQTQLRDLLEEELKETDNISLMRQDSEMAQSIEEQYMRVPFASPILFTG